MSEEAFGVGETALKLKALEEEVSRLRELIGQHCDGCTIPNICPGVGLDVYSSKMDLVRHLRGKR